jgi:hypothetical protein
VAGGLDAVAHFRQAVAHCKVKHPGPTAARQTCPDARRVPERQDVCLASASKRRAWSGPLFVCRQLAEQLVRKAPWRMAGAPDRHRQIRSTGADSNGALPPGVAAWTASRLRSCHRLRAAVGECVVDHRRPKDRRQPLGHPEDVVRDVGACWVICPEEESNESYRAQMARTRCRPNGLPRAVRRPAGRSRCWGAVIGPTGGASAS